LHTSNVAGLALTHVVVGSSAPASLMHSTRRDRMPGPQVVLHQHRNDVNNMHSDSAVTMTVAHTPAGRPVARYPGADQQYH
jgi:hypothetical protein